MSSDTPVTALHYVGYDRDHGGILSVVRRLADAAAFKVVLGVNDGFQQTREPRVETLTLPAIAGESIGPATFWRAFWVARAVQAWLATDVRRVFHGHSRAGLVVALWLRMFGEARVVVSVHCYGRHRWFYRYAARRLGSRLYWLTPAMKQYYLGLGGWEQCLPGCAGPLVPRTRPTPTGKDVVLGGVGTLVEWKRWDMVLHALALLPTDLRGRLRFVHVGGDDGTSSSREYRERLRRLTEDLGLAPQVDWLGPQPSADRVFAECNALVVASHNEPFSIAMLEALAAGLPVVAADTGGARDIVVAGRSGWLFRSGDVRDLARALGDLLSPAAWAQLELPPPNLSDFSPTAIARRWEEIYARLSE